MILMDWKLGIPAFIFFCISWLYAWGLLRFFGDDPEKGKDGQWFLWDWASVCGIFFTASLTYTIIWQLRKMTGYPLTWDIQEQHIWDLFVMFLAALPAMRRVRIKLVERRKALYQELLKTRKEKDHYHQAWQLEFESAQQASRALQEQIKINAILREQLEAKKNCEQRWKEQNSSLKAVLRIYEVQLNISPTDIISPPAQPEWLNVS